MEKAQSARTKAKAFIRANKKLGLPLQFEVGCHTYKVELLMPDRQGNLPFSSEVPEPRFVVYRHRERGLFGDIRMTFDLVKKRWRFTSEGPWMVDPILAAQQFELYRSLEIDDEKAKRVEVAEKIAEEARKSLLRMSPFRKKAP